MNIKIKTIINYITIFTIFSGALTIKNFFSFADLKIIYFLIPLIFLLFLPFLKNTYFDKSYLYFITFFSIIIIFSIFNIFLGNNNILLLSKQVFGIFLTSSIFFLLFKINNYDAKKLFNIYLNFAFIVAFIGLIQEVNFLLNFKIGYDFSHFLPSWRLASSQTGFLRLNSILPEPSGF